MTPLEAFAVTVAYNPPLVFALVFGGWLLGMLTAAGLLAFIGLDVRMAPRVESTR